MSLDLQVDLTRPLSLTAVVNGLPPTLSELLDVRDVAPVQVSELRDGRSCPADLRSLVDAERAWTLSLVGHPECAFFGGMRIEDSESSQGYRAYIWIDSRCRRTPLEHALVAAVAVVVARLQQTRIVDHALFFTPDIETSAEDFVRRVRVQGPFHDISSAASFFNRRLSLPMKNGVSR